MSSIKLNIHSKPSEITFTKGIYHIYILGGWYIEDLFFNVRIKNLSNGNLIDVTTTKWKIQSFEAGRRAKRYFEFEILENGKYELSFVNPETLLVKKNNFFIWNFLLSYVDNKQLEIIILRS